MAKIIGNTTATPNPRPDWNQTDETKADYIKNKPDLTNLVGESNDVGAEIFNDYENNIAEGEFSHAEGKKVKILDHLFLDTTPVSLVSYDATSKTIVLKDNSENDYFANNAIGAVRFYGKMGNKRQQTDVLRLENKTRSETVANEWSFTLIGELRDDLNLTDNVSSTAVMVFLQDDGAEAVTDASHTEGFGSVAVGQFSHAEGWSTVANGRASHTEGWDTKTLDNYSHAEGGHTTAYYCAHAEGSTTSALGHSSHAEGFTTEALGQGSHSEGQYTHATKNFAHAEGNYTWAEGESSHAQGYKSRAEGTTAHAEGHQTHAKGYAGHAEGYLTVASGAYGAHAEGSETQALGDSSHAGGKGTIAEGAFQTTVGRYNIPKDSNVLFIVGNGNTEDTRSNAFEVLKDGSAIVKSAGTDNNSVLRKIDIDGLKTEVSDLTTTVKSKPGTRVGSNGEVFNSSAVAGPEAHSEGRGCEATGWTAHAEGYETKAAGLYAHSEGRYTQASGLDSHAEGCSTEATGGKSHASGYFTKATATGQFVAGMANEEDDNALFIIGNGAIFYSDSNPEANPEGYYPHSRSNAFKVMKDGSAVVQTMGTTDNSVATKKYVDDKVGNIEAVLDSIITIQEGLIGGATE